MKNIFWNRNEKRLRAGWRLVFFTLLLAAGMALQQLIVWGASRFIHLGVYLTAFDSILSVGVVLGVLWLCGRLLDRRPLAEYGFHFSREWWIDFGFGLGLGAVLMGLIFVFELGAGWVEIQPQTGQDFWARILNLLVLYIAVGIREEISFRAYFLRNLAEGLNWIRIGPRNALIAAFVFTSGVFGLAHLANPNATWVSTLNIALAGIFLGLGLVLSGEMAIPIAVHISWNFFQGNVFGFPVSGMASRMTFIAIRQGGPELWTGGAFGPEAGLLGLAAMLLGCALTLGWVRLRRGNARLQTPLAVYPLNK